MSTSIWTPEADHRLRTYLATNELSAGRRPEGPPCSLMAINLALTGRPTRAVPECMSAAIAYWIIFIQKEMPGEMRNGRAWKDLLPRAAMTGRHREQERLKALLDWVWNSVLPILQGLADRREFGGEWRKLCAAHGDGDEVRMAAARDAGRAARRAGSHAAFRAAEDAAWAVSWAKDSRDDCSPGLKVRWRTFAAASTVAEVGKEAARAIGDAAADSSVAAATTAGRKLADTLTVGGAARAAAISGAWSIFNPVEMLRRAIWAGAA